jgi:hypothetical protein
MFTRMETPKPTDSPPIVWPSDYKAYDVPDAVARQMEMYSVHLPALRQYESVMNSTSGIGTAILSTNVRLITR